MPPPPTTDCRLLSSCSLPPPLPRISTQWQHHLVLVDCLIFLPCAVTINQPIRLLPSGCCYRSCRNRSITGAIQLSIRIVV
uniref:Uncharacterized protein n=1 Tax=Setaria viridis TaxID=4556 RepID=A0A4V6D6D6_SETVI|nr:hypothetical protein SEVIR_5G138050v2 [Setaria viridis]